jgi:hypothetical protein
MRRTWSLTELSQTLYFRVVVVHMQGRSNSQNALCNMEPVDHSTNLSMPRLTWHLAG